MRRVLSTAFAVLVVITATFSFSAYTASSLTDMSKSLTPGITLIGEGVVPGMALDKSGLTGNIWQQNKQRR